MQLQRLDNRRLISAGEEETTAIVSVTKSYARLNPVACALLGVTPGVDCLGFGFDAETQKFVFYKAPTEKEGKKLSPDATLNSESIYKRLVAGVNYTFGAPVVEGAITYFSLEEVQSEVAASIPGNLPAPLSAEAYATKYSDTSVEAEADGTFL